MWLDIAYFFRALYASAGDGGTNVPKIYGIFTMYDNEQATEMKNTVRAANCYGALLEYNFFNHTDTTYSMTFPSGLEVSEIKDPPFDYTLFVSRSGKNPAVRFNKPDGTFDERGLNQMVALNIFADVSGDSDGMKDAIRTDWYGHDGYRQLKQVREGETATMVRCMASFGLTAVWYPKYRIATGASCLIGKRLCESWLKTHNEVVSTRKRGRDAGEALIERHLEKLTSPPDETPLRHAIDELLSSARRQLPQAKKSREFERKLRGYPRGEPFRDRFDRGRDYYALMEQLAPICQQHLVDEVWALYREQLNLLDFGQDYGLGDIETFFLALDGALEELMKECPTSLPKLDLDELDFSPMRRAEQNTRLWLVGLREKSVKQHQDQIVKKYIEKVNQTYVLMRNYFLRPILEELRQLLGFAVQAEKEHELEERKTIQTSLDIIKKNLRDLEKQFDGDLRDSIDVPKQINVAIVANNNNNSLEEDMKRLAYKIDAANARRDLLGDRNPAEFLDQEYENINIQVKEVYRRYSLAQIDGFQVVNKALEMMGKSRSNPIEAVARRSTPCQTFNQLYKPLYPPTPPTMISGLDPSGNSLSELQVELRGEGHAFERISTTSVDHLLFFYNEEAGFAIDDLESHKMLYTRYREDPGPYGHLTRQDSVYFDIEFSVRKKRLERWLASLAILVPAIRRFKPDAFAQVLRQGSLQEIRYVYSIGGGIDGEMYLLDDTEGIETLAKHEKIAAYQWFIYHIHKSLITLTRDYVQALINDLIDELPRKDRNKTRNQFQAFLDEVYAVIWSELPEYEDPGVPTQRRFMAEEQEPAGDSGRREPVSPEPTTQQQTTQQPLRETVDDRVAEPATSPLDDLERIRQNVGTQPDLTGSDEEDEMEEEDPYHDQESDFPNGDMVGVHEPDPDLEPFSQLPDDTDDDTEPDSDRWSTFEEPPDAEEEEEPSGGDLFAALDAKQEKSKSKVTAEKSPIDES